jgi:hypothetical protein
MSIKRSSSGRQPVRGTTDSGKTSTKVDRQELFDELRRRADSDEPFLPSDVAAALGITELVAGKYLLLLSSDGFLERIDGGKFRAAPMREISPVQFLKELQLAAKNPQREKDLADISRLRSNNDIMRERLLAANSERDALKLERDRYLELLRRHDIDPNEPL